MPPAISSALYAPVRPLNLAAQNGEIGRIAARSMSDADKAKLAEQAEAANTLNQSMKTARDEARGNTKARAKETVERLKEEFKLIRRMWAHNPKEMAKQLARVAKELKHAVAD
jgi:transposase-like protein